MIAVKGGHLELVRYLLQYSVVKSSVPVVNKVCNACHSLYCEIMSSAPLFNAKS